MPDMPQWISKGPILKRLDEKSVVRGNLEALLSDLRNETMALPDIARQRLGITDAEAEHLRVDWFDDATRWWRPQNGNPGVANPGPVVRHGLIAAIEFALNPSARGLGVDGTGETITTQLSSGHLPLDCYWVCQRGGDMRDVSVAFGWSPRQVTVMIHTPHAQRATVDELGPEDLTVAEPIRLLRLKNGVPETVDPKHRPSR